MRSNTANRSSGESPLCLPHPKFEEQLTTMWRYVVVKINETLIVLNLLTKQMRLSMFTLLFHERRNDLSWKLRCTVWQHMNQIYLPFWAVWAEMSSIGTEARSYDLCQLRLSLLGQISCLKSKPMRRFAVITLAVRQWLGKLLPRSAAAYEAPLLRAMAAAASARCVLHNVFHQGYIHSTARCCTFNCFPTLSCKIGKGCMLILALNAYKCSMIESKSQIKFICIFSPDLSRGLCRHRAFHTVGFCSFISSGVVDTSVHVTG